MRCVTLIWKRSTCEFERRGISPEAAEKEELEGQGV